MKKQTILLLLSTLSTLTFYSCIHSTVKTEETDITNKYYLSSDTTKGGLSVDIEIELPAKYKDKVILDSIRNTIITNLFGKEYLKYSNDTVIKQFVSDIVGEYKADNGPFVNQLDSSNAYSFNYEHTLSGFSLLSDKHIYTYGIERSVYTGGAHGTETRNYYNFNLTNGKVITESDLFNGDYKNALAELIKKRIVEESKEDSTAEPIMDLENTDYWIDAIKPNGNFYITDESINYVFNPYEIAPYYMGQTEVTLPYERITKMLKPDSPIAYLVKKHLKM